MNPAKWTKGKRTITGWWSYNRHYDTFVFTLDVREPISGQKLAPFMAGSDKPEFNGWKLAEDPKPAKN